MGRVLSGIGLVALAAALAAPAARAATADYRVLCDDNAPTCAEPAASSFPDAAYIGHDEPALLFYSAEPGSGYSSRYLLRLPEDPPMRPQQDGTGGTFNFQLHPAFWFGMAMCDSQSAPNPGKPCPPDSDANIFDNPDPEAADYIGKHPGAALMELQFYPPGWVMLPSGPSCDALLWCAALNIDSLSVDMNSGAVQNRTCRKQVGIEYVNFAFVTRDGRAQAPANPVEATAATYTPDPQQDLFMRAGDWLLVDIDDTPQGLRVAIRDLTSGDSGTMTASAANGFGQVGFAPTGHACDNIPYDFHPMYATSSERTRVPWAGHSLNIGFSDEIGHFEYCGAIDARGHCLAAGKSDPFGVDPDDRRCLDGAAAGARIAIIGCTYSDLDFDGPSYRPDWPGARPDSAAARERQPQAIRFSSPLFRPSGDPHGRFRQYDRVAFETDLPGIETATRPRCNTRTGAGCVDPPAGARFYPFYSTRHSQFGCVWQLGGAAIPGTQRRFGDSATAEYGALLALVYPVGNGSRIKAFSDFRRVLPDNPCRAEQP